MGPFACATLVQVPRALTPDAAAAPPAQPGTCEDVRLLSGTDRAVMGPMQPAGHDRITLRGFSVTPPLGANWCEAINGSRTGVVFIHNNYAGESLTPPPPTARRRHTLVIAAFLVQPRSPPTLDAIAQQFNDCISDGRCTPDSLRLRRETIAGADCIRARSVAQAGSETGRELHDVCIHPSDPPYAVRLVMLESHLKGQPWYATPLSETFRADYDAVLNSLRFTSVATP